MKKLIKSFEFTILVKWILASEALFWFLILVNWDDNGGLAKYQRFQEEGTHTVQVHDYNYNWDKPTKKRYLTADCKVTLDGKEYTFVAQSHDLFNVYDEEKIYEAVEKKERIRGYLYSSQDRRNIFFSRTGYDKNEFIFRKLKEEFENPVKKAFPIRLVIYGVFGIFAISRIKSPKQRTWKYLRNEDEKYPFKDKYTNRAIKNNPEYNLQQKEVFAQNYPREIVAVAKNLRSGVARVSPQQTKALKETGEYAPSKEEWTYGRSVMTELSTTSPADAIYRIYREGHFEEDFDEPEEKVPLERKLEGPILNNYAVAREAVLLKAEPKKPFQKKRKLMLVERTREGDFAIHKLEADYFIARKMPGNYVMLIKDKDIVGVYENVMKNEENPIMLEYESRMKKIRADEKKCHFEQFIWIFFTLILLVIAWSITKTWFVLTAAGFYMVAVNSYRRLAISVGNKYEKKQGKLNFEGVFHKIWSIPYGILKGIAVVMLVVKCICFGTF